MTDADAVLHHNPDANNQDWLQGIAYEITQDPTAQEIIDDIREEFDLEDLTTRIPTQNAVADRDAIAQRVAELLTEHPGYGRGGKFAFTVPDVTGDGRDELALVGLYGFGFGVVPSETPLEKWELPDYLGHQALTGCSSGNQEARLYHDGAVVRAADGTWLGVVAINPGGVDFFAPTRPSPSAGATSTTRRTRAA